jgi:hypothetical protein
MRCLVVALLGLGIVACGNSGGGAGSDANGDDQPGDDGGGGPNTPHTVKLTLTNKPMNAGNFSFVVAYQDGGAAWQLAPAPTGDTYSFEIHAPSYGVAYTCIGAAPGSTTTAQVRSVTAAYFAVGERTDLTLDVPARCSDRQTMGNIMLNGTVTNRPIGGTLVVVWGGRTAFVGAQTGNFQLSAPAGTHDLLVVHAVPVGNGDFYSDEVFVARDVALSSNTNRNINFGEAVATSQYYVDTSAVGDPGARITTTTTLYTANGTSGQLVRETGNPELQALSDVQMKSSDVYDQSIQVSVLGRSATVTTATSEPTDMEWNPPAPFGAVQSSVAAKQPYVILQSTWPAYADVDGYMWNATQQLSGSQCGGNTNTACTIIWQAYLSPGVTGAMPAFRMPDLAALSGWKSALELVSGTAVVGSVTAYTSTAGAGDFPGGVPANGTVRTFMRSDYSTTP